MDRMDFAQGVVRTRVIEKRLLSKSHMVRLMEARDMEDVLKILSETEYSHSVASVKDYNDYEKILSNELIRVYDLMRDVSPDQTVVDLPALKYDYHNLKVFLKSHYLNKDLSYLHIPVGTLAFKGFYNLLKDGSPINEDNEYKEALEAASSDFELNHDPQNIDLILDRYYYEHFYKMAAKTNVDLFVNYVKDMIDFTNIKSFVRLHKQKKSADFFERVILPGGNIDREVILSGINEPPEKIIRNNKNEKINQYIIKGLQAYEKTGSLTELERFMDNYLMELNKGSRYIIFGPEPVFSYILAKETEIKNLRIIMASKVNNMAPEVISERLRDLYV